MSENLAERPARLHRACTALQVHGHVVKTITPRDCSSAADSPAADGNESFDKISCPSSAGTGGRSFCLGGPFGMVMRHELGQRPPQGPFPEEDELRQAFLLYGANPLLRKCVQIRAVRGAAADTGNPQISRPGRSRHRTSCRCRATGSELTEARRMHHQPRFGRIVKILVGRCRGMLPDRLSL